MDRQRPDARADRRGESHGEDKNRGDKDIATTLLREILPPDQAIQLVYLSPEIKHQLSHQTLRVRFMHLRLEEWPEGFGEKFLLISPERLTDYPFPQLINRYMESGKI